MKKHRRDILAIAQKYRGSDTPSCEHFGECGGCLFQDIAYTHQQSLKLEYLNTLFAGMIHIDEIVPSSPYAYRNRMDYVTAFGKIGLRKAGRYRHVVDVTSCALLQHKSSALFQTLRPAVSHIEDYDYLKHEGYLRYIVLRQGFFTGETMVNFITASAEDRISAHIADIIAEAHSASIIANDSLADISFGTEFKALKQGNIFEEFDGIRYRITPNSFFQSNSHVARELYRSIKSRISGQRVLDLFSGAGTISLYIADAVEHVTGVELSRESVMSAEENKRLNAICNADFICADATQFVLERAMDFDTIIIDPPRGGLHPKLVRHLAEHAPKDIIYVSCNPPLLRQDLEVLAGFSCESITAFDMFPQTPHVELMAILCRK
jgi:23S rRNA (uracil-5-)-methyltransferase RumA